MNVHREKAQGLSSSLPPVLDTHRDWAPSPLEWQKGLPQADGDGHKPAPRKMPRTMRTLTSRSNEATRDYEK